MPEKKENKGREEASEASEVIEQPAGVDEQETMPEEKQEAPPVDEKQVLMKRNEELLTRLMYLQAEFENLQKRVLKERQEIVSNAQEGILRALLPVLDDLDKALEMIGDGDSGLAIMNVKLVKVLDENGLKEIPAKGEKFDPFLHEAVEFVNDVTMENGAIKEVVRKGYRCNLKVLRPSLVVVVKNEGEKHA